VRASAAYGALVSDLPTPVALAGGHAVRERVKTSWMARFGQDYFGSRDIDLAYFVTPGWTRAEFAASAVAHAPRRLRELGFEPSGMFRFRLVLDDDGNALAREPNMGFEGIGYHILYVDPMVTAQHPLAREVIGFTAIDEPLLASAFSDPGAASRPAGYPEGVLLPSTALLVATKLSSLPRRTKGDKPIKDLCDLYALVAFGGMNASEIRGTIHALLSDVPRRIDVVLQEPHLPQAIDNLGIGSRDFQSVIGPLAVRPG